MLFLFSKGFFIYAINSGVKNPFQYYHLHYYPAFLFLYILIRYIISPTYFDAEISGNRIVIKAINPAKYYGLNFILLVLNKIKPSIFTIDRISFTNYKIAIYNWGFNKSIILQKLDNGYLIESKPIRMDYLGYKKYTDLIISIDRLCQKMSLN